MMDEQGNVSLIVLLSAIRMEIRLSEIPKGAAIPIRWDVITIWWRNPDESGIKFEQRFELVGPDDNELLASESKLDFEAADTHRHIGKIQGFPVPRAPGRCFLKLYIREDREGSNWGEPVTVYPLTVDVSLQGSKDPE
jgi:hypothetical protein